MSDQPIVTQGVTLAIVAVGITAAVYGVVALIVKADDVGLHLAGRSNAVAQAVGRGLVKGVPVVMTWLAIVGTAAMLWVGGQIVTHGAEVLGLAAPAHVIHDFAEVAHGVPGGEWLVSALLNGVVGLVLGGAIAFVVHQIAKARGGAH
ncbi:DUF808 family protein [Sphingomonas sp. MMS24-JH45]